MKGTEIFKSAVRAMAHSADAILTRNQLKMSEVDWVVPHQANLRLMEAVSRKLGIPMAKFLVNIQTRGNTSAATVPTVLDEAVRDGRIKPGQTILMDAFGAGITYGTVLIKW